MKIIAVVVTYNRVSLLKECITAIRRQTRRPDSILVVNNGSTDDTGNWLATQIDLRTITQDNLGSGGGQHAGIKFAYEVGADWIWTMDDDGLPDLNALQRLLDASEKTDGDLFNSLVLDISNPEIIAFGYHLNYHLLNRQNNKVFYKRGELINYTKNNVVSGVPQLFNSSLINKNVIKKVGLPFSPLFIRGDEVEYVYRIQKNGFKTYTVLDSIIYHPNPAITNINICGYKIVYESMNNFKLYYSLRNRIFIDKLYRLKKWTPVHYFKKMLDEVIIGIYEKKNVSEIFGSIITAYTAIKDYKKIYKQYQETNK